MTQLKQVWAGKNDAKQINPDLESDPDPESNPSFKKL